MSLNNYEEYRKSLAKQIRTEKAKDYKDYNKAKKKIEEDHDAFIQILNSSTKPDNISDDNRKDYINGAIESADKIKSQKLDAITRSLTQQDRIFMILKYHQDHDPYYLPAQKLSRTKREIEKMGKKIAEDRSQLKTLDDTINEQQQELNDINERIKEVLLSTPNNEIGDAIEEKLTGIKLDKRIIRNIKKAISTTSRNADWIIIINKKHRDEWFKESKDFKLKDWTQKILWEFLIQIEWHPIIDPTPTNDTKSKSTNTGSTQKQSSEKNGKERIDNEKKDYLKKQLKDLQDKEKPDSEWYIILYKSIFKSDDDSIDNINKLVKQLNEGLKKRPDLRSAIEFDLSQRIEAYPQPQNLEKLRGSDNYRISFCNNKWNLLLSWDFTIIWLLSYEDYKKFQKNN